jgi:hypothetical protein
MSEDLRILKSGTEAEQKQLMRGLIDKSLNQPLEDREIAVLQTLLKKFS